MLNNVFPFHTSVLLNLRDQKAAKCRLIAIFLTLKNSCWISVNMNLVGVRFSFILHQKPKNLLAEWSNGELSTRLYTQLAGGNVCSEHKDIGLLDACRLLGSWSPSPVLWCSERRCWYFGCVASFALCIGQGWNHDAANFFRPAESPINLSWNKAVSPTFQVPVSIKGYTALPITCLCPCGSLKFKQGDLDWGLWSELS